MKKLAIIGAGSMSEALISGMIENHFINSNNIWITNRNNSDRLMILKDKYHVSTTYDLNELLTEADVVILAMKPKDTGTAVNRIKAFLRPDTLLVSVLAGVSVETLEDLLGIELAIVRAMPNTSATVGQSATALSYNDKTSPEQVNLVSELFKTIGLIKFVNEEQLDAVTGLSGSGPAYFYYLVEAMEKSAMEIGLEQELAKELIVQTLLGAANMLKNSPKTSRQLRIEVTSPGGTTEAGIRVLEDNNVQDVFIRCIKEATKQSKRLGNVLSEQLKTPD